MGFRVVSRSEASQKTLNMKLMLNQGMLSQRRG